MSDVARMASLVVNTVKAAQDPLLVRIAALESRTLERGDMGPPGEKGMDGATGPPGRDGEGQIGPPGPPGDIGPPGEKGIDGIAGRDGIDGKDGQVGPQGERGQDADGQEIESLRAEIVTLRAELGIQKDATANFNGELNKLATFMREKVALMNDASANTLNFVKDALASLPVPEKGADGHSVTLDDVQPLVALAVKDAVASLPVPKDGQDGASVALSDVEPIIASEVQKAVSAIPIPKDGVGVMGALLDRAGHLVLTLSDGSTKDLGEVIGKDGQSVDMGEVRKSIAAELAQWPRPKDGKDGADGVGFDDLDVVSDEHGRQSLKFVRGDVVKTFRLYNYAYQGPWKEGTSYEKSDGVSWDGSLWTAISDTTARPGTPQAASRAWVLTAKRGRDGADGKEGKSGPPGKDGKWG